MPSDWKWLELCLPEELGEEVVLRTSVLGTTSGGRARAELFKGFEREIRKALVC